MIDRLAQAKGIDMVKYLSSQGFHPVKEKGDDVCYLSPFRSESSPSFYVSLSRNTWVDFGREMKRCDILDFVMEYESCTLPDAINKLLSGEDLIAKHIPREVDATLKAIEVIGVEDSVTNPALVEYMEYGRVIPIDIVNKYCKQVSFQFASKRYITFYGVAMENSAGGFSIRSTWFKGASSPASVSYVKKVDGATQVSIFEGITDWLSYVVLYGEPDHDVIVLHSLVYITMLLDHLKEYKVVHGWLDNDHPAQDKMDLMKEEGIIVVDHRYVYVGYGDLNEYLVATKNSI